MSNVINLHRTNEDVTAETLKEMKKTGAENFIVIGLPKDLTENDNFSIYTNFEAGVLEVTAVELCKSFLEQCWLEGE